MYVVKLIKGGFKMELTKEKAASVLAITRYDYKVLRVMKLGERIAHQKKLKADNHHTAVLIVDAVVQGNEKVLDGLLAINALHVEQGSMNYEMQHFRDWLSTLLVK